MNILAIETTGAKASVAMMKEDGQLFFESSEEKLNHLQNLMPMVEKLLEKCRLTLDDVTCIAVSEGPGSFTGIRIGVSSARALAQALRIDTIGVPTLKSIAYNAPEYRGIICPIFDARRNQVYGGAYQWDEAGSCKEIVPAAAYDLTDLLKLLEPKMSNHEIMFFGDGIEPYQELIQIWNQGLQSSSPIDNVLVSFAQEDIRMQNATSVVKLAYELYREGEMRSLFDLKPVYMRKAEAERKLEESSK